MPLRRNTRAVRTLNLRNVKETFDNFLLEWYVCDLDVSHCKFTDELERKLFSPVISKRT